YALERARERGTRAVVCAGACAGYAAISNYAMAAVVLMLGVYLVFRLGWRPLPAFAIGVAGPLLLLIAYNQVCFATPLTSNYAYQNPLFVSGDLVFGVFTLPRLDVLLILLFSPFRGLFFTAPVLLLGVAGLVLWLRAGPRRAAGWLIVAVTGFVLLLNA